MAKFYVTRYALTRGILEVDCDPPDGDFLHWRENNWLCSVIGEGRYWHRTMEDAVACAEKMRQAKIVALERQRKKLQGMQFQIVQAEANRRSA